MFRDIPSYYQFVWNYVIYSMTFRVASLVLYWYLGIRISSAPLQSTNHDDHIFGIYYMYEPYFDILYMHEILTHLSVHTHNAKLESYLNFRGYTPHTTKLLGGILVSLRLSVRQSTPHPVSALYHLQLGWILSIFGTNDQ